MNALIQAGDAEALLTEIPDSVVENREFWLPRWQQWDGTARAWAADICARDDIPEAEVAEMLKQVRASRKTLDAVRLASTAGWRDAATRFNANFRRIDKSLSAVDDHLKRAAERIRAQKAEAAAAARAEAEAAHAAKLEKYREAATARQVESPPPSPPVPEPVTPPDAAESPLASASGRALRVVVVDDATKLPRQYLVPNMALIKKDALAGEDIPGVRIEVRETIVARQRGA